MAYNNIYYLPTVGDQDPWRHKKSTSKTLYSEVALHAGLCSKKYVSTVVVYSGKCAYLHQAISQACHLNGKKQLHRLNTIFAIMWLCTPKITIKRKRKIFSALKMKGDFHSGLNFRKGQHFPDFSEKRTISRVLPKIFDTYFRSIVFSCGT